MLFGNSGWLNQLWKDTALVIKLLELISKPYKGLESGQYVVYKSTNLSAAFRNL
jgi:hypothetical protein